MGESSTALRSVVIALLLVAGVGLAVFATQTATRTSTTSYTAQQSASTTATSTTTSKSNGTITFSSPWPYEQLMPGQSYNISGTITPAPRLPDSVVVQVSPQGSLTVLDQASVAVQPSGLFSYSAVVGFTWEMVGTIQAPYIITVTDSGGATATEIFVVVLPTCSPVLPSD